MLQRSATGAEIPVHRAGIRDVREKLRGALEPVGKGQFRRNAVPLQKRMVHLPDHPVGDIRFGRIDEEIIPEKWTDIRVGLRIERERLLGQGIEPLKWDLVSGELVT